MRPIAITKKEIEQLFLSNPREDRRIGNLITVKMENGQNRAITRALRNLFECQDVAIGPVSASPSPTTQATMSPGLSKAAP